jgi:hypothetical protein
MRAHPAGYEDRAMSTNVKPLQGRHRASVDATSAASPSPTQTLMLVGVAATILIAAVVVVLAWQAVA